MSIPTKPIIAPIVPDAIPQELTACPQWIHWEWDKWDEKKGKWSKPPLQISGPYHASSTNPRTWSAFEDALAAQHASHGMRGLGFCLTPPIIGIDLDYAIDGGVTLSWAQEILDYFSDTYAEVSPSGTGYHLLMQGELPHKWHKRGDIEIYTSGRCLTVTGRVLHGRPSTLASLTADAYVWFTEKAFEHTPYGALPAVRTDSGLDYTPDANGTLDLTRFAALMQRKKFSDHWNRTSDMPSDSERALGLVSIAAHAGWTPQEACVLLREWAQQVGEDYPVHKIRLTVSTAFEPKEHRPVGRPPAQGSGVALDTENPHVTLLRLFGLSIDHILQSGIERAAFTVIFTDGHTRMIGTANKLAKRETWHDIVITESAAYVGAIAKFPSPKEWPDVLMIIRALIVYEPFVESDSRPETHEWVDGFMEGAPAYTTLESVGRHEYSQGRFAVAGYGYFIGQEALRVYLHTRGYRFEGAELVHRIRDLGYHSVPVQHREIQESRKLWVTDKSKKKYTVGGTKSTTQTQNGGTPYTLYRDENNN